MINNTPNILKQHQDAAKARLMEQQARIKEQMDAKRRNEKQMIELLKSQQIEEMKKNELSKKSPVYVVQERVPKNETITIIEEKKITMEIPKKREVILKEAQEMYNKQRQEVIKKSSMEEVKKNNNINVNKNIETKSSIKMTQNTQQNNTWDQIKERIKKEHEEKLKQEMEKKRQEQLKAEMEAKKRMEEEKAKKEAEIRAQKELQRQMELKKKEEERLRQLNLQKEKEEQRRRQWKQHQENVKKEKKVSQEETPTKSIQTLGKPTVIAPTSSSNNSSNESKNITQQPFKTTVTQQLIQQKLTPQTKEINKPIKTSNQPSISVINKLQTNENADIIKKQTFDQKNVKVTDTNKSSASNNSIRSIIKLYPFSQLINIMPPIQLPHGDENSHHTVKDDNSWQVQHRVIPEYEIPSPKKMEIPELKGSVVIKPTVIPPQVIESTRIQWNEFPEDPQYEIEHGQKVKTQEWVPVNDEEKIVPKASYKPSRINRVWPPPEMEREINNEGVLKVKTSDDTAWIQNQNESLESYPVWQQKTGAGSLKSRAWPPQEQDMLKSGYSGPNQMGPIQWPPPEFEEHEQEIVEVIQTHLPVNKHQRQWPPEPPKMVPAGTIQNE
ncbi:Hypothetical protein SRAE_1000121500 [Strongyloides ratti]|uniref:Uncharacterized protein n=1 Tax=Strongyloides ratti TaxID=34506 RepID=A0A090MVJ6_STRRB|nr:Hypothetical protein SRAE_1000121500 [Strongyloides ratti]CEF62948.1 Hypothetical protein SRAE_1000121500 [Strongyloides ratti]